MLHVKDLTNGRITLGAGTIYQTLSKLEGDGLISAVKEEDRKKFYKITDVGNQILHEETERSGGNADDVRRHLG
jgi:DNA-binding PadR family transcriptional regulator